MTQKAPRKQSGSITHQAGRAPLADAIDRHAKAERASFHTPGHKGISAGFDQTAWKLDVTELPELDELAYPAGVLASLEKRASKLWSSNQSFISVNGASAAIIAAICACSDLGKKALIPVNAHRSVINGLIISGLEPIWYEPSWNADWSIWSSVDEDVFSKLLSKHAAELAFALVVTPTYAGSLSSTMQIAKQCNVANVPLIVDEAHGAHFVSNSGMPESAIKHGADLVVHSLHKTLSALTQTGMLHFNASTRIKPESVRMNMNLIQSSSPSYLLMTSIESAIAQAENPDTICSISELSNQVKNRLHAFYQIYCQDPAHIMLRLPGIDPARLNNECCDRGVYPEALLGNGVLFLIGINTSKSDVDTLVSTLHQIVEDNLDTLAAANREHGSDAQHSAPPSRTHEQVLTPRQAFFAVTETVPLANAVGRIAADCLAPCPPGTPIIVPGQRVTQEIPFLCKQPTIRVVVESQIQGER